MQAVILDLILLLFLVICAVAAVRMRDLLSATIVLGAYSLIMAVVWTLLNAVDVAFTEASVGAGITTVLMLATISRTARGEAGADIEAEHDGTAKKVKASRLLNARNLSLLAVAVVTSAILIYGTLDLPDFGDPDAPIHKHVADRYIEKSHDETASVNFVTAVLASYRGYDTLGETTVIFTAGLCVVLLLRRSRK